MAGAGGATGPLPPPTPYGPPQPWNIPAPPPPGYLAGAPAGAPPPRRSPIRAWVIIGAILAVVLVVLAIVSLLHAGTLNVHVLSNHVGITVIVTLAVDGQVKYTSLLGPGEEIDTSYTLTWFVQSCEIHSVSASSTGGAAGPESDSAAPTLCAGGSADADLLV